AGHDDRASFERVLNRRGVVRAHNEVMVGLVYQYGNIGGDAVEEQLDFLFWYDISGRVVRVADVDKTYITIVQLRRPDNAGNIHPIVFQQGNLDRVGLAVRCVAIN